MGSQSLSRGPISIGQSVGSRGGVVDKNQPKTEEEVQVARHILIVFTEAHEGREGDFNSWYDDIHLSDVLSVDGYVSAQRYVMAEEQAKGFKADSAPGRYLAIYEIEAENLTDAHDKLAAAAEHMYISESMDATRALAFAYTAI
jgi:hypothetical protein